MEGPEEKRNLNVEEVKKYLRENGLDESLIDAPFFSEYFSDKTSGERAGIPSRKIVYFNQEENILNTYFRDVTGHKTRGEDVKLKKDGNLILVEELSKSHNLAHYSIDDPLGDDVNKYSIRKIIRYIDENGSIELAKEIRECYRLENDVTEADLYTKSADVKYEINEESFEDRKITDYPVIMKMKECSELSNTKRKGSISSKNIAEVDKQQGLTTTEVRGIKGFIKRLLEIFKGKGER